MRRSIWVIRIVILTFMLMNLASCMLDKGAISIKGAGSKISGAKTQMGNAQVFSVSIVNDQLVVTGENLEAATEIKVTGDGFSEDFSVESATNSQVIANGLKNVSFKIGSLFNLIISDAYGSATFSVTFELQDEAVTASKIHNMGASEGQVLRFSAGSWGPSDLNTLSYAGQWDATSGFAPAGSPAGGDYYIVSVAGSTDLAGGVGTNSWQVGDWAIYNDVLGQWEKIENSTMVTTFNGRNGVVTPQAGDYDLQGLSDVDMTGLAANKILKYDGTKWIVADDNYSGGSDSVSSSEILDGTIVDADISGSASISQSKIQNLTSDLASKLPLSGGSMSGTLDMGGNNIINPGTVDGVDISNMDSRLSTAETTIGAHTSAISTNQTNIANNTTAIGTKFNSANVDTDTTLATNSDTRVPSQRAIKTYVDAAVTGVGVSTFVKRDGSTAMTGALDASTFGVRFKDGDSNYVTIRANASMASDINFILPGTNGTNGYVLSTDGAGNLSWVSKTSGSVTNVGVSSPLQSTGGATPTISLPPASGAANGYLSSVDWNTFNSKQAPLTTGTNAQYFRGDLSLSNFNSDIRSSVLSGFISGANTSVLNTDTIESAFGKVQGQINATVTGLSGKEPVIGAGTTSQYWRGDKTWQTLDQSAIGLSNVDNIQQMPLSYLDTTATLGTDDAKVPSQNAVKTYVDNSISSIDYSSYVNKDGSTVMTGALDTSTFGVKIKDGDTNYVTIKANSLMSADLNFTLPGDNGTMGYVLSTDGSGNLSWIAPSTGSVTNVAVTAPLQSSGGATPTLYIDQANAGSNGYITAADWTTFNNKQNALTTGATTQYFRGDLSLGTFDNDVAGAVLTAFITGANSTVVNTDTVLGAVQKLQGQIDATNTSVAGKEDALVAGTTAQYYRGDKSWQTLDKAAVGLTNVDDIQQMPLSYLDTTVTLGVDDAKVPSQNAVKTYVDTAITGVGASNFVNKDGSVTMTGALDASTFGVKLKDGDTNYVTITANAAMSADLAFILPADNGTGGYVLSTDGAGNLSWIAPTTGSITSVSVTAPLQTTGGTTPTLSVSLADTTTDGYLSSTDWNTFNNKQAAITTGATTEYFKGDLSLGTFATDVAATVLTGYVVGTNTAVANTDTVQGSIEKLQGQINANSTSMLGKEDAITAGTIADYYRGDKTWQILDKSAVGLVNVDNVQQMPLSYLDTTTTLGVDDAKVPSQNAVKTYVDTAIGAIDYSNFVNKDGSVVMTGALDTSTFGVKLKDGDTNYVTITANAAMAADLSFILPADNGTGGYVLSTDGAGNLSWIAPTTGSVTNVAVTAPLQTTGGATPTLSVALANTTTDGYLSSVDWNTFNNKQAAITTGVATEYFKGDLTLGTFATDVAGVTLTGFVTGADATVDNTDTVETSIEKLQGQVDAAKTSITGKQDTITTGAATEYFKGDLTLGTFATDVAGVTLTGFVTGANATVDNTDTVETSIEKLQGQVDAAKTSLTGKEDALTAGTAAQYYRGDKTWQTLDKAAVGLTNVDDIQQMPLSYLDTTTTLGTDDAKVPSQNAVKTYVDSNLVWSKNVNDVYYNAGNVGIGTTAPQEHLHIYNSADTYSALLLGYSGLTGSNGLYITSDNATASFKNTLNGWMNFYTNNIERLRIDASGNVGIGTTTPTSMLHVKGAITSETNGYSIFNAKSYSDTESPHFVGYRARGTEAAPTYPLTGDALATFQGRNGIDNQNSGGIVVRASEDQSATNHGTEIRFQTTTNTTLPVNDRMIIGHDGKIGIGTMTPASKLEVAGGGIVSSYSEAGRSTTDGAMRFTASTGAVLFDANGNKRVSWNDGQADLAIRSGHYFDGGLPKYHKETGDADGGAAMLKMLTDGVPGTIELSVAAVGAPAGFVNYNNRIMIQDGTGIVLSTGGGSMQERMRIKTDGLVGIGTSNPQYKLDVSGGDINASGNVRSAGVVLTSDERFKTDIQVIENATEKLKQLAGVSYVWRRDEFPDRHFNDRKQIGVIAQDVEKIFPELVDKDAKGYLSVNYPGLIAPLIQSVKEQDERISELENSHREIASLKEENESLKKEVSDMKEILCEIKPDAKICN